MSETLTWSILDAQTRAANQYNDDALGFTAQRLWVIDGATGISDRHFTPHISDAAWLAETTASLLTTIKGEPVGAVLERLETLVKAAFTQVVLPQTLSPEDDLDMPCACLGMVQLQGDVLEVVCVGDISIVIAPVNGPLQVFSDQSAATYSDRTLKRWRELSSGQHDAKEVWAQLRPTIRQNRQAVNQPGGYTVIHPTRSWAHQVSIHRVAYQEGMRVLLASDGAWRLVDLFGVHDARSLLETVTRSLWSPVLDELRLLEAQDPKGTRYSRIKPCDDATGLLAQLSRGVS